jgi:(1->4)-alpha-D-glucan 1-alpha-D-glucosylmutase
VSRWRAINRRFKTKVHGGRAPDLNEEYHLYQTLVGAWPFEADTVPAFRDRVAAYMTKAMREAKVYTSWLAPDDDHERAVLRFIDAILEDRRSNPFLQSFLPFQARVADLGAFNSLAQLLIKVTAPGVPDFYQGSELWDLSLVDPDNRRPVDYQKRSRVLAAVTGTGRDEQAAPEELLATRADGRVKMFVTARALAVRARLQATYEHGGYIPLETTGAHRECLFAFARLDSESIGITCVPRLIASLVPGGESPPVGRAVWGDTGVDLSNLGGPGGPLSGQRLKDELTGATIEPVPLNGRLTLPAAVLFERFPAALLVAEGPVRRTSGAPSEI